MKDILRHDPLLVVFGIVLAIVAVPVFSMLFDEIYFLYTGHHFLKGFQTR